MKWIFRFSIFLFFSFGANAQRIDISTQTRLSPVDSMFIMTDVDKKQQYITKEDVALLLAQALSFSDDTLYLTNGGNVYLGDYADQQLTISNDTLFLEDGGFVLLTALLDNTDDQQISISNDTLFLEDGGYVKLSSNSIIQNNDGGLVITNSNDTTFIDTYPYAWSGVITNPEFPNYGDTISAANGLEFLQKLAFLTLPASSPSATISSTPTTYAYSVWKLWPTLTKTIDFNYSVTNNSKSDLTDDAEIVSIELYEGVTLLDSATPTADIYQTGVLQGDFVRTTAATSSQSRTYTLKVVDSEGNEVTQNQVIQTSAAIRMTYSTPSVSGATSLEKDDINSTFSLTYSITPNDEAITDIQVRNNPETSFATIGSTASSGNYNVTFYSPNNGGDATQNWQFVAYGDIYSGYNYVRTTASKTQYDRYYLGLINTNPCAGGISGFTSSDIIALDDYASQLSSWTNTNGYLITPTQADQYIVFGIPTQTTPNIQANSPLGWQDYSVSDVTETTVNPFVNELGYNGTNYKVIGVCVPYTNPVTVRFN